MDRSQGAAALTVIGLIALTFSSCGPGEGAVDAVLRRDSSGVSIVESYSPQWRREAGWHLSADPLLSLGNASGDPAHEFTEVVDARVDSDGGLVVADLMAADIRFFSGDGTHMRSFGRRGEGPGEFQRIQKLGTAADSVWVFDRGAQRVTWLSESSEAGELVHLVPPRPALLQGRLSDGSWLVTPLFELPPTGERLDGGIYRGRLPLLRYGADGQLSDTLLIVPGTEMVYVTEGDETRPWGLPPFGRRAAIAVGGSGLFVGDQDRFEIREYDLSAHLVRIIRLPDADLTITDEEYSTMLEGRVRGVPEHLRPVVRSILSSLPRASARPAYADFMMDQAGNLWVAMLPTLDQRSLGRNLWASDWKVFAPDGSWLGTVAVPQDFQPTAIGDQWIVGIAVDSLGINRVQLYELLKEDL
jgi:hypothetical protein